MKIIIKILIVLVIIFIMFGIVHATTKLDRQRMEAYANCHQMVDIDGNYKVVCGE